MVSASQTRVAVGKNRIGDFNSLHHPSHTFGYVTLPLSPTHTCNTPQPQNAGTPDQSTTVRTFTRDQTRPFDSSHVNASKDDDLASFNELTVAPLLDTLRRRFFRLLPYTYISDIVIAVNPYKAYPHMTTLPDPLIPYGVVRPDESPRLNVLTSGLQQILRIVR